MAEKPIIFSTDMVKAILDGRKTVTRRVIKLPDCAKGLRWEYDGLSGDEHAFVLTDGKTNCNYHFVKPRYQTGDLLWAKETFRVSHWYIDTTKPVEVRYEADGYCSKVKIPHTHIGKPTSLATNKWRSSRFMPKWAARIWLEVLSVRAERLQEITEEDIWKEGIVPTSAEIGAMERIKLWDSLNAKRGYPWESNPWVWRYEFKIAKQGSDELHGRIQ